MISSLAAIQSGEHAAIIIYSNKDVCSQTKGWHGNQYALRYAQYRNGYYIQKLGL